ncbi:MAG TPA: GGDEF domain-containing protein [Treponemataceae bacterium]|nr:GGDEF domain-containing protein [Treponemataceae bacterium]
MLTKRPLRLVIMTLVFILVSITWFSEIREVIRERDAFALAKQTLRVNAEVDAFLQAAQNLAFERGRTNVLLAAQGLPSPENRAFIEARRAAASENIDRLLADQSLKSFPAFVHIESEYASLGELRTAVDQALERQLIDRSPELASHWFAMATSLIDDLAEFSASLSLLDDRYSTSFRNISRLKALAFDLRNTAGMEASRIAAATQAAKAPSSEDMERIMSLRGEGSAIWKALRRESRIANNKIAKFSVEMIEREFFDTFRPIQNEALMALHARHEGRQAPVDLARLTAASVPALDSIAKALNAMTAESASIAKKQYEEAKESLILATTMALIALACGLLALFVTVFRLFAPLKELGIELIRLSRGDVSTLPLKYRRRDELGRAYGAVEIFRESLIERRKLEERLTVLSNSDGLTGIANRRRFDEILDDEWRRAARGGTSLALAIFDVDLFKGFNDTYGHLAGDECLKSIARAIDGRARRPGDLVARYGGEEFVAILPGLSRDEAEAWANAAREAICAIAIPHGLSATGFVTISGGVAAAIPSAGEPASEHFKRADEALYAAKRGGRNRVVAAGTAG